MLNNPKAVLFDLDGTLLDTMGDIAEAVNHVLRTERLEERSVEEIRGFLGTGPKTLILKAIYGNDDFEPEGTERLLKIFREYYDKNLDVKTQPYPGTSEMLDSMKKSGKSIAVVSNKYDAAVHRLCDLYFPGIFGTVFGMRENMPKKPEPEALFEALDILGVRAEDALYVGDSEVDVEAAKNAGICCIGCSWGFRGRKFLEKTGCKLIIDSWDELNSLLKL